MMFLPRGILRFVRVRLIAPVFWTAIYSIAIFVFLPSWNVSDINKEALLAFNYQPIERSSQSSFVTRVYDSQHFYNPYGNQIDLPSGLESVPSINNRWYFSFDLAFDNGGLILRSGASEERFKCLQGWNHQFGDIKYPIVNTPDQGGILGGLPWTSTADEALTFLDTRSIVSETSMAVAPMRSFCRSPQSYLDRGMDIYPELNWDYSISLVAGADVAGRQPLVTVGFGGGADSSTDQVKWVEYDTNKVLAPSYTYPIRKMALGIIAPTLVGLSNIQYPSWMIYPHLDFLPALHLLCWCAFILWIMHAIKRRGNEEGAAAAKATTKSVITVVETSHHQESAKGKHDDQRSLGDHVGILIDSSDDGHYERNEARSVEKEV